MDSTLFRILYCSRNFIEESGSLPGEAIEEILAKARQNNRAHNVTGALLYSAGFFAQVLEGPRSSIEHLFEKIQRDPRHGDVTVLECSDIHLRDFGSWAMAHIHPVSDTQAADAGTALQTAMGHPGVSGQGVLHLLRSLVTQED